MCLNSSSNKRTSREQIDKLSNLINKNPIVQTILSSVAGYVLILDKNRQILAANQQLIDDLKKQSPLPILGQRPGELLLCVHSHEKETGCGTSEACQNCGALMAMLAAQTSQNPQQGECFITSQDSKGISASEYALRVTPMVINNENLLIFVIHDISHQKWRNNLERIFLHDMNNSLSALSSWGQILENTGDTDCIEKILLLVKNLINTVESQQILVHAENNELQTQLKLMDIDYIFKTMKNIIQALPGFSTDRIEVEMDHNVMIQTDPLILCRILFNMLLNAFEASSDTDKIELRFMLKEGCPRFSVKNPGVMAPDTAQRVFNRSYSTKGQSGRGWGTYSMKLLGENILKGSVGFTSTQEHGTEFFIILQKNTLCFV